MSTDPFKSVAEVRAFQKKHGLVPDGIVGRQTRRVLAEISKAPSTHARLEPDKTAINQPLPKRLPAVSVDTIRAIERQLGPAAVAVIRDQVSRFSLVTARPIDEIIAHCTATPEGRKFTRNDVNAWHKERGWDGIGYHALILLDGILQVGRPIGQVGIHTKGHNERTVGYAYVGGLTADAKTAKDTRTPHQTLCLYYLCERTKAERKIRKRVTGHNEYAQKACPSFNVLRDPLGQI